jgi:hypothetical protein
MIPGGGGGKSERGEELLNRGSVDDTWRREVEGGGKSEEEVKEYDQQELTINQKYFGVNIFRCYITRLHQSLKSYHVVLYVSIQSIVSTVTLYLSHIISR